MSNDQQQFIDFLMSRWRALVGFAAIERVYLASCDFSAKNNMPKPDASIITIPQANRQITIIKEHIVNLLPDVSFIKYEFELEFPLRPNDFVDVFVSDHFQCISKVYAVIKKLQIQ